MTADRDLQQTFQALSEAERQATILENRLSALEGRLAAFLEECGEGVDLDTLDKAEEEPKIGRENGVDGKTGSDASSTSPKCTSEEESGEKR